MAEFTIKDEDLTNLKGKVVIVTGGSSGIGLATVSLLLSLEASVISADINPPPEPVENPSFLFVQTNVAKWAELTALFKKAKEQHGRIDCVFANAGIGPRDNYLALETDENGDLKEPSHDTINVNLLSAVNTGILALHYLKQQPEGGSIVLMGSSTSLHPVRAPDYSLAKSGVLGFGRGLQRLVEAANLPIRVNTLAPSWTTTQLLPSFETVLKATSAQYQTTSVVARAAAYLMVDGKRAGDVIFIAEGRYTEIEHSILAPAYEAVKGESPSDDEVFARILALAG